MRFILAGIILCSISAAALGQAEGDVESIGFDGYYRPNCWTAMKLRLRPTIGTTETYKLAIVQEDLDRDRVVYTRPFTLNGNSQGARIEEKVWVYFRPQPRDLARATTAGELSNLIKIFLCTESGKQLVQIPIPPGTTLPRNLDDATVLGTSRGTRLILVVGGSASKPLLDIYGNARGISEEVQFIRVTPGELPGNVLGYEAVDAILWLDSDPAELRADALAAVEDYVRDGGHLVVGQNQNWQKMKESAFAAMLPVTLEGMGEEKGAVSLRLLADVPDVTKLLRAGKKVFDPWADLQDKTLPIAKATPKAGAIVNEYCVRDPVSPYLARWMYGLGTVGWVAQDFGDPSLISRTAQRRTGWQKIWDRTFDWHNNTRTQEMALTSGDLKSDYDLTYKPTQSTPDLSTSLLGKMELPQRGAALVAITVVFFVGYWLVAGPGSYFFLLARKQAHFSWLAFAACALGATALTVGVVKLVLRGPPQVQHVTFVRVGPDQEAVIQSQFGLYIPRDGVQRIRLKDGAAKRASYVAPYPLHPDHVFDTSEYPAYLEYEVPMRDRTATEGPAIGVPYRSTLKKFQAKWVGQAGGIDGRAALVGSRLSGRLGNNTGRNLHSVYMIYMLSPDQGTATNDDFVIYLPDSSEGAAWPSGKGFALEDLVSKLALVNKDAQQRPKEMIGDRGFLNIGWMPVMWAADLMNRHSEGNRYDNADRAAVIMSIYDRLLPSRGSKDPNVYGDRYELLRRAGRQFDASGVVSSGQLLILARSDDASPLPFPLEVDGEIVKGEGVVYYQFIVPLERSGAATQPTMLEEEPAAAPPAPPAPAGPATQSK
jgi:hypothetical protein